MYKLIIIDAEKKILDGVAEIFPWNQIGFEVTGKFTCASEALAFLEKNPADVVMTDIRMPDMDGLELVKRLKSCPDLQVVILSSYAAYSYMRQALLLDVADYLLKPVNYNGLLSCYEKIRARLDERNVVPAEETGTYYEKIIGKVDEFLRENYQKASLNKAADLVGISSGYLSRIYKDCKGTGFMETLSRIRMERAGELLKNPAYKSYEIASLVGYDNPKSFTRAFKAYYQVTPRDYRNGIRKTEK